MDKVITVRGSKGTRWQVNASFAPFFLSDQPPNLKQLMRKGSRRIIKDSLVRTIFSSTLTDSTRELPVVTKIYKYAKLGDWLKANLLGSKARNEWRITTIAADRGLRTVIPVAFGERRSGGILRGSYLLTAQLFNCVTLSEALFSPDGKLRANARTRRRLIVVLAELLKEMHNRGIYHRDLHPGNFLVEQLPSGESQIYLLDLHRASVCRSLSLRRRIKSLAQFNMFATISLSNSERLLFFNSYFGKVKKWQKEKRILLKTMDDKTRNMRWRLWKRRQRRCLNINKYFNRLSFAGLRGFARRGEWKAELGEVLLDPVRLREEGTLKKESRSKALWEKEFILQGQKKTLVIKQYKRKRGWKAIRYLLRTSQSLRSWKGAYMLEIRKVNSTKAIAALERRDLFHRLRGAYFISEKITDAVSLDTYITGITIGSKAESVNRQELIRSLAFFIRRIHTLGIYHGDMKATNILVREKSDGGLIFFLTDLDHIRAKHSPSRRQILRNLYQLNKSFLDLSEVGIRDRYRFLSHYTSPYKRREIRPMWRKLNRLTTRNLKARRRRFYRSREI